jgi:hypothetical protein
VPECPRAASLACEARENRAADSMIRRNVGDFPVLQILFTADNVAASGIATPGPFPDSAGTERRCRGHEEKSPFVFVLKEVRPLTKCVSRTPHEQEEAPDRDH